MTIHHDKVENLIVSLQKIYDNALTLENTYKATLDKVHPEYRKSAENFIHFLALRARNTQEMQTGLTSLGISSLKQSETHVLPNIYAVLYMLHKLINKEYTPSYPPSLTIEEGMKILNNHVAGLFGSKNEEERDVYIMVTLATKMAYDYIEIKEMILSGMDCARINCAKDGPDVWQKMIDNVKRGEEETGRKCKILMDLGGPKLRTGDIKTVPETIKIRPSRDVLGKVIRPVTILIAPHDTPFPQPYDIHIPVEESFVSALQVKDEIHFTDIDGNNRVLVISELNERGAVTSLDKAASLQEGTILHLKKKKVKGIISNLPRVQQEIKLAAGDILTITKENHAGQPQQYDCNGSVCAPATIGCTLPEIFDDVRKGERIIFDDGKIEGVIKSVAHNELQVEILMAQGGSRNLKNNKGINLPDSELRIRGLTDKDLKDLDFVVQHADIVNISFVRTPEDIAYLYDELDKRNAHHLGIMFKIETQQALRNMPWIVLESMRRYPVGVMIARGDMAVECGWKKMANYQEEIIWLCQAAHMPSVWATQVLERLAKKGLPSRAEITDAARAQKSNCVMLNKGKYMLEAIETLSDILENMRGQLGKHSTIVSDLKL